MIQRLGIQAGTAILLLTGIQLAWNGWFETPEGREVISNVTEIDHQADENASRRGSWKTCMSRSSCIDLNGRAHQ